jgi:Arc/MetJ family transcription regulator
MEVLRLLYLTTARAFYGWALREIDPLHPDVPRLVLRRYELNERARRRWQRRGG